MVTIPVRTIMTVMHAPAPEAVIQTIIVWQATVDERGLVARHPGMWSDGAPTRQCWLVFWPIQMIPAKVDI
jgi:hypothetical protein